MDAEGRAQLTHISAVSVGILGPAAEWISGNLVVVAAEGQPQLRHFFAVSVGILDPAADIEPVSDGDLLTGGVVIVIRDWAAIPSLNPAADVVFYTRLLAAPDGKRGRSVASGI